MLSNINLSNQKRFSYKTYYKRKNYHDYISSMMIFNKSLNCIIKKYYYFLVYVTFRDIPKGPSTEPCGTPLGICRL